MTLSSNKMKIVRLTVKREDRVLYVLEFSKQTIMIGRSRGADVPLNDDQVSRQHAVIQCNADGTVVLVDSGSRNGVYLNGGLCQQAEIKTHDVIRVGTTEIGVELFDEEEHAKQFDALTKAGEKRRRRRDDAVPVMAGSEEGTSQTKGEALSEETSEVSLDRVDPAVLQMKVEQEIDKNLRKPDFRGKQLELPREVIRFRAPTVLTLRDREWVSHSELSAAGIIPKKKILQVSMSWFGDVMKVTHYAPGRNVYIGESLKNEFVLPCDTLPESFLFIRTKRKYSELYFTAEMQGEVEMAGSVRPLQDLKAGAEVIKKGLYTSYRVKIDFFNTGQDRHWLYELLYSGRSAGETGAVYLL